MRGRIEDGSNRESDVGYFLDKVSKSYNMGREDL